MIQLAVIGARERAHLRKVWPFGFLPVVHLWHEPQPQKAAPDRLAAARLEARTRIPRAARVAEDTA
ncbi:MAG TPA: hypothetical protein VMM12_15535 [Longimicrobiales bacterium]|nr:hypothetical protein [Longimicrobiales bacterium]